LEPSRDERAPVSLAAVGARRLIEALPYPVLLIGPDDTLLAHNEPALTLWLRSRSSEVPRTFGELSRLLPIPDLDVTVAKAMRGGPRVTLPGISGTPAGRHVVLDITVDPLTDDRGVVVAVLISVLDRSKAEELRAEYRAEREALDQANAELHLLNEELRDANERAQEQIRRLQAAEEADIRKDQFLAMLAHELRNPLGAVVNALQIIQRLTRGDRNVVQAVRIAQRQLQNEARLLDDLLDVSRIVLGKITVRTEAVDLRDTIRTVIDGSAFAVESGALQVTVDTPEEPLTVMGDPTRLEQCVGNLVSNAIKFTSAGGRVAVRARRRDAEAVVTVSDSGVGMRPETLERVFGLFEQGEPSLARARGGLGIGLTLTRRLVELHGGSVTARSGGPGHGSEFEIVLPLTLDASAPRPEPTAAAPASPAARRILIVEDNRDAREMLRTMLELDGHTVVQAGDGLSAIRLAVETVPDVVLMDIGLPELDGFEVARRIRARLGASIRLVALSGYGDPEARDQARRAGFDAHLVKPVAPDELTRLLSSL
jgi:two-component system, sensor histidine kinase